MVCCCTLYFSMAAYAITYVDMMLQYDLISAVARGQRGRAPRPPGSSGGSEGREPGARTIYLRLRYNIFG